MRAVILLALVGSAHADTWKKCQSNTLIRVEPAPHLVCDCPATASQCAPCPTIDNFPFCEVCPPRISCLPIEAELEGCKRINAGLLSERDGFAALHQREAADNRRCKKSLRKCRNRK